MLSVLAHALDPKLSARDALVFSTLSRETFSMRRQHTHIEAVLPTTSHVISFGLWMQQHGKSLRSIAINSDVMAGASTIYLCAQCPGLMSAQLTLDRYETFGFHFLWMLHDLHLDISHATESRVSLATTTFPLLETLVIENKPVSPRFPDTLPDAHRKVVALPDHLPNLTHLLVRHAFLEDLPSLPRVQELALPSCRFGADTVSRIGNFTTLTSLDVSKNVMRFLPDEFAALVNLQHLDVSRNHITNYDDDGSFVDDTFVGIESLTALTSLTMHHNYVDNVGFEDAFPRFRCSLRHLDIACTPATDFPLSTCVTGLTSLRTSSLPKDLHRLSHLNVLYVHGHCEPHQPYEDRPAPSVTPPPSLQAVYLEDHEITRDTLDLIATFPSSIVRVDTWL